MSTRSRHLSTVLVVAILVSAGCSGDAAETQNDPAARRVVEYLEEITPPCTPVGDPPQDPCRFETVPYVETPSVTTVHGSLQGSRPNVYNRVLGVDIPGVLVPHIAIRGTGQAGTTRCEAYRVKVADYVNFSNPGRLANRGSYYCFVDVAVGEYLIGTGPPTLTVAVHREHIRPFDPDEWPEFRERFVYVYSDPRARTAAAYEGREMVMLLRPTSTIHVEAWTSRGLFTLWFVQRRGSQLRAVAYDTYLAGSDEERTMLNVALSDLVSEIRSAGEDRTVRIAESDTTARDGAGSDSTESTTSDGASVTVTTPFGTVRPPGGFGARAPVPVLVTDANYLRNLYIEIGATYEGDNPTTVLPPPVPPAADVEP